ncbi:MAG TPA: MBL fold metallo-hydrolase [Cytophagales bacterium]|nr:MBL fold metallo-hydrolase [Cytophagales bacterium]
MALPTHNPRLKFIKEGWTGNQRSDDGRSYLNIDGASEKGLLDVLRWQLAPKPFKNLKRNQKSCLDVVDDRLFLEKSQEGITWLGHTTYVVDVEGLRLITDPILYDISFIKRFTPLPCEPSQLLDIDFILLSHNHRDHIDEKSLKQLCTLNPQATILTGLQTGKLLRQWKIKNEVIEAGWYQTFGLQGPLDIHSLPAKHWTRRYLKDTNLTLWGSFMIASHKRQHHLYFGADSGYGMHYKDIADLYPSVDVALLGIGAYEPYWFMHPSHTGPEDALKAIADLKAKCFMPMHYGTFDLSDEPVFYPEQKLKEVAAKEGIDFIKYNKIGEKTHIFGKLHHDYL